MGHALLRSRIGEILGRGRDGAPLRRQDAYILIRAADEDLPPLLAAAGALRDRYKGRTITYSRKVFIPLTTLCRDYCGYCTFRKDPGEAGAHFMTPDEVLAVAQAGARAGCQEALFSLGDQPEAAFAEARAFLAARGHRRTLEYLAEVCGLVLERTGLLPHANPGLIPSRDLARLKETNASMGIMLENVSRRLGRPGGPHFPAPDKDPRARLRTMEEAGKLRIAFTTGILIGIGETPEERVDSLYAIRDLHAQYGHIQEVIVQNFRAKPDTPMAGCAEPELPEILRTLAVARLILGGEMNLQAPPNLTPGVFPRLLDAGINDWGGVSPVTADFINPEMPWPAIESLDRATRAAGFHLRPRLAIYPEFVWREGFLAPAVAERVRAMADADGYPRACEAGSVKRET